MRKNVTVSIAIATLIWVGKAGAWDSDFNDRSCYMPPQMACNGCAIAHNKGDATVPKLTVAEIAEEMLKMFDLDGEALGFAMEELHNRVKSEEADREVATKMLTEGFLDAMRRSNEKELREFARIKFESFSAVGRKPN